MNNDLHTSSDEIDTSANKIDYAVSAIKGSVGLIPWIGPLVAEVIGNLIPNQRIDRIDKYLRVLAEKVRMIEREQLESRFHDPGFIDLFEDSLHQVIKALTQERIEHIASLVKNSLSDEQAEYIRYKHLLGLLSELNDIEVLLLQSYSLLSPSKHEQFWEQHKDVLSNPIAVFSSPQEEIDKSVVHDSYKDHLVRLGLFRPRFVRPRKDEPPELDTKTGMVKAHGYEITPLGRLLVRHIDLDETE